MKPLRLILPITLFILSGVLALWWNVFKYKECIDIGHSKTYCILNIGGK